MDLATARDLFREPPMQSRPAPFWFWNDRLDPRRIVAQFDALVEAGAGGAVLHARSGLSPDEYLTPEWFAAIRAVTERAAEIGACVWLYDELGWPSGSAGGRVPGKRPELRMVQVRLADIVWSGAPGDMASADVVAAFRVTRTDPDHGFQRRLDGGATLLPDRIRAEAIDWPPPADVWPGARLLVFYRVVLAGRRSYLDAEPTKEFIRLTHEAYLREVGAHFGKTIRHIFMDEPGSFADTLTLPWTATFERDFERRRGYALPPHLPALFFETPGHEAVRFDYWTLVSELFREGFAKPLGDWCEAHGIALSGHYHREATLKEAMRDLQATMPLYEYQGMPGIDILGDEFYSRRFDREPYGDYVVTVKQAASAASQLGKPGLMSESYGVGGNAMGPEAMQIATNWQMALGVTFVSQHATFYSVRAERKLDCPPYVDWRQPWWRFARKHFDAIARTGWLLSQGETVADVLLLHPAASMEATYRLMRTPEERKSGTYLFDADLPFELIDKHFTLLCVALTDAQVGFELGDEELMAKHGSVAGGRLRVGARAYTTVVLPPLANLRSSTVALLRDFMAQGGTMIAAGSLPALIDGRPSREAIDLLRDSAVWIVQGVDLFNYDAIVAALSRRGLRSVVVEDTDGKDLPEMKVMRRRWEGRDVLFVANISRRGIDASLRFTTSVTGRVEAWDTSTGATWTVSSCTAGSEAALDDTWARGQARAYVTVPERDPEAPVARSDREASRLTPVWIPQRNAPNVLLLDECRLAHAGAQGDLSISQARRHLGGLLAGAAEVELTTRYAILVAHDDPPAGPIEIAIERCGGAHLALNGHAVPLDDRGEFLDPAVRRFALPPLRPGPNELEVRATYRKATELQSPILLGEFLLSTEDSARFTIRRDAPIGLGAWSEQGLSFYHDTVTYRAEVDGGTGGTARLELPGLHGSARVRVNGVLADDVLWPPYRCEIALQPGRSAIEVEVAGTLRNLFGPLYEPDEDRMTGFSDDSYTDVASAPKRFRDYGLLSAPEVILLDRA